MRIVYVTDGVAPYVLGGMQTVSRRHVELLAERGAEVLLLHSLRGAEPPERFELPVPHECIDWPFRRDLRRFLPGHYVGELRDYSLRVLSHLDPPPDVVYAEGPLLDAYIRRPPAARAPVVFHPHGLNMFQQKNSLLADLRSMPLRNIMIRHARAADAVISQGGRLHDILARRMNVPEQRIETIPNGVDGPTEAHGPFRPRGERRMLFVGRDEPLKGVDLLLRAMSDVPARLDLVGPPERPLPRGTPPERIRFLGEIRDRERLERIYAEADAFVLSSFSEGMPTVVLEAMRAGLPVVATDVGAVAECVVDGETGWIVPPGDRNALAAALRESADAPANILERMSAAAQTRIEERFLQPHVGDRLFRLCARLADGDRRAPARSG